VRTEIKLRDYQTDSIQAVWSAWANGMQRPAVVLPTGSGKTVIFAHLARDFFELQGGRVVVLVHRDELADQTIKAMQDADPKLNVGKVKAADNDITADVMVCSVQTLARGNRLAALLAAQVWSGDIRLAIVDEAHHAAAESYRRILTELGCFTHSEPRPAADDSIWRGTRCVGFTATLARGDGVGLGDVWQEVVFSRSVLWMISRGYLVDVRGKAVDLDHLNLATVKRSGGDYQAAALGAAIVAARGPEIIATAVLLYAADRRPIVFLPDVASALATRDALNAAGVSAAVVTGTVPREERLEIYRRYRTGELRAIVNCMVLTEGADFPWADCAVIARPTTNPPLYIQMVGRVLRPYPGKADALVLDVTGAGGRLATLIDLAPGEVTRFEFGESLGEAAVREEAEGNEVVAASNIAFSLKHRELDMFGASSQAWLKTPAGVLFIPVAGVGEVFLWPVEDGLWDVCLAPGRAKWQRLHQGMPLGTAQAWAETEAEDRAELNSTKKARWRKEPAHLRQVAVARSYRVEVGDDPRKGELSDAISTAVAADKFDEWMKRVKV